MLSDQVPNRWVNRERLAICHFLAWFSVSGQGVRAKWGALNYQAFLQRTDVLFVFSCLRCDSPPAGSLLGGGEGR